MRGTQTDDARYLIEDTGAELRQYIVAANDEEKPFSRDQRRWVYASAKRDNNYFGFGSDNDFENANDYLVAPEGLAKSRPDRIFEARPVAPGGMEKDEVDNCVVVCETVFYDNKHVVAVSKCERSPDRLFTTRDPAGVSVRCFDDG